MKHRELEPGTIEALVRGERSQTRRVAQDVEAANAPQGAQGDAAAPAARAQSERLTIDINTAEELDDEIREIDLLIAELTMEIVQVENEQVGLGNTERSLPTRTATAPFRQHIAELEAERSHLSHARTRFEAYLSAWAAGRWPETEPPRIEHAPIAIKSDRNLIGMKFMQQEADVMAQTLEHRLRESVEAVQKERAGALEDRP